MAKQARVKPIDVGKEIMALLEGMNCKLTIMGDMVFVDTPTGELWNFTVPEKQKKAKG